MRSKLAASKSPARMKRQPYSDDYCADAPGVHHHAILKPGSWLHRAECALHDFPVPEYGVLALGMMACMIAGGIDLSLVGIMNLSGVLAALIVKNMVLIEGGEVANPAMVVPAIVLACVVAVVVGAAAARSTVSSSAISACRPCWLLCAACSFIPAWPTASPADLPSTVCATPSKILPNGTVAGIPYVLFIFIAVVAVVVFIMKCTVFGHEIYFLGSNAQAAMYSGHQHAESHDYDLYVLRYPGRYFRVS